MQDMAPFYLVSTEHFDPREPRRCTYLRRLRTETRHDLMLVAIEPPLHGQPFGLGGRELTEFVLGSRFVGSTLFPISEWPVYVYRSIILERQPGEDGFISNEGLYILDWAALYPKEQEARRNQLQDE